MESVLKSAFRASMKQLQCCISADFLEDKDCQALGGCIEGPAEQNQRTQGQKRKRAAIYTRRKAQRAAMRTHIREKYQLPKNEVDKKQMEAVRVKVKMQQDFVALVRSQHTPESDSCISGLSAMDLSPLKKTTQHMMQSLRPGLQCPVM